MRLVPFDAPVPGWPPGGSYGHSRLHSCSFVLWPTHLLPGDGSACGTPWRTLHLRGVPTATVARVSSNSTVESSWGEEVLPIGLRFELYVDDVEASVRFYGATLRFAPPETWSSDGYVPLRGGVVTIGVQNLTKLPTDHHFSRDRLAGPRGVGLEIVIEVDDVDRAYALASPEAERHHGRIEPLGDRPWGARDFRLIDPDGYYVRVTSRRD